VVPFALEAATCAIFVKEPGIAMPGVNTPALGLPYPSLDNPTASIGKTLVVFGGSSSAGSMTTQIAAAAGIQVIAIAGAHSTELCKDSGASEVFDRKDPLLVQHVVDAVQRSGNEFVGIFDSIAIKETLDVDLAILEKLGGGHLALTHPPVSEVPENVNAGMIFAVNDVATPVWRDFVTPALESGKIKCLPRPTIVGNGLEYVQEALLRSKNGVSGTKLVVTF
jgi:NADPH:quinone reductase-like Zn-dependent oxidoreductase